MGEQQGCRPWRRRSLGAGWDAMARFGPEGCGALWRDVEHPRGMLSTLEQCRTSQKDAERPGAMSDTPEGC